MANQGSEARQKSNIEAAATAASPKPDKLLTLQESLFQKRPDFVQRSELRVQVLKEIKMQRLIYAERYQRWLDEASKAPSSVRPLLKPPAMPKTPRLFSYRQMVAETRAKYYNLPEIIYGRAEAKRKSCYQTNRLKADMYKKRLQTKVLQGRVSLAHHNQILRQ